MRPCLVDWLSWWCTLQASGRVPEAVAVECSNVGIVALGGLLERDVQVGSACHHVPPLRARGVFCNFLYGGRCVHNAVCTYV